MTRHLLSACCLLLVAGCAGKYAAPRSEMSWAPQAQAQKKAPSPFANMEVQAADQRAGLVLLQQQAGQGDFSGKASGGSYGGPAEAGELEHTKPGGKGGKGGDPGEAKDKPQPAEPLVVYMGYLKLRVKRVIEALDRITAQTEQAGGYIESMTADAIIVRIPAKGFDAALTGFAKLGDVLDRRVKAMDVSEQFTDLSARLAVAKRARERLLALLEQVKDVSERLKILQEVKRLSEQIEGIESSLATLRTLLDYSTITIDLVPVVRSEHVRVSRSPFGWVRGLRAHVASIEGERKAVGLKLPKGFVLFDKDDSYRAQAADTTTLRAGRVANEPRGDNTFWSAAVRHEFEGREEEQLAEGTAGGLAYRIYRSRELRPRCYLVGVHTAGEHLWVVEVFFPNQASYDAHQAEVLTALKTFKVKK